MSTALLEPVHAPARPAKKVQPARHRRELAPAVYIGTVAGFRELPAIDLYNLLAPVGEHPVGSTVSRKTLERFGFRVAVEPPRGPARSATTAPTPPRHWQESWCA
jgi:hypothetical protein